MLVLDDSGAGVAGLAAIQTAKNMGAIVSAYDVRPAVAEQVERIVDMRPLTRTRTRTL